MISTSHLLTIYLGIELLSLSLISLVALKEDSASIEAAVNFVLLRWHPAFFFMASL